MNDLTKEHNWRNKRQSNFELLRIMSMVLIIAHHFAVHGGYADILPINGYVVRLFEVGGKIGVNIFILISGYFLIDSEFSYKKLIKLIVQTFFYSITIYLILLACGKIDFTTLGLVKALFPTSSNLYWFATLYVIMYCLFPCLNAIVKNCPKSYVIFLIIVLIIIQSVIPFIFANYLFTDTAWFLTLYLIAAFLKLHPVRFLNSFKITLSLTVILYAVIAAFNMFTDIDFWVMTHLACLICSVAFFHTVKNVEVKYSKVINRIAKTTFGIYLIHDNPLLRRILWVELLNCPFHANTYYFIVFACVCVLIVFIVCMVIDSIRELIFYAIYKKAAT